MFRMKVAEIATETLDENLLHLASDSLILNHDNKGCTTLNEGCTTLNEGCTTLNEGCTTLNRVQNNSKCLLILFTLLTS